MVRPFVFEAPSQTERGSGVIAKRIPGVYGEKAFVDFTPPLKSLRTR